MMAGRMPPPEWEMQRMGGHGGHHGARKISGRTSVPPSSASEFGAVGIERGNHHNMSSHNLSGHNLSSHNLSGHNLSSSQRMLANSEDLHAWSIYRQVSIHNSKITLPFISKIYMIYEIRLRYCCKKHNKNLCTDTTWVGQ
jgi:hypothetical protein